tara:strand:- start:40 stop:1251 length:1212 start_codon:yes stop_codon:yes gene_type:complete
MVVATKKKSTKELKEERLKSFNNTVGEVKQTLKDMKFVSPSMMQLFYLKKMNGSVWRTNGRVVKDSMTFLFRTNKSRNDLLNEISDNIPYRNMWSSKKTLSGLGHLEFNVPYEPAEGEKIKRIKFHVVVKYKDKNAFRSLPYTNALLEERKWKSKFSNRGPDTSDEHQILKTINDEIYSKGGESPVDITLDGQSYLNIIGFIPGPSGAHADFVGINEDMEEVCFLSHKMGTNAKHFQQYSGISSQAGDAIHNDQETEKFREVIASKNEQDFDNQSFSQDIRSSDLQTRAVLGPEWNGGGTDSGINNCSHFMQGNVSIRRTESKRSLKGKATLVINFSAKNIHASGISSLINSSEYSPTLGARKTNENRTVTFGVNQVRNVRGGIFSSAYIKERKTNIELSIDE